MKRLLRTAALPAFGALLLACQNDPGEGANPVPARKNHGRLGIAVALSDSADRDSFFVFTLPASRTAWTDGARKAALDSVPAGRYKVYAVGASSVGQAVAIVRGGDSVPVDLEAMRGRVGPELAFRDQPVFHHVGDTLELTFGILEGPGRDSSVTLEVFNRGGLRAGARLEDAGPVTLRLGPITLADSIFHVLARFPGGLTSQYRVAIRIDSLRPPRISARWEGKAVVLAWTRFRGNGFQGYRLHSHHDPSVIGGLLLKETSDPDDTVYRDMDPAPLDSLRYSVTLSNRDGLAAEGPVATLAQPGIRNFRWGGQSVYHPTRPWLYTVLQDWMFRLDYQTGKTDSVPLPVGAGFMDIGDNGFGQELYIPVSPGRVLIMDAETLDTAGSINAYSEVSGVASNGQGRLMISARTPYSLMAVDRRSLAIVSSVRIGYQYRLHYLAGGEKALGMSVDMSPVYAYLIGPAGQDLVPFELPGARESSLDARNFQVSPDGTALVSGAAGVAHRLDSSFTRLGALPPDTAGYACFAFSAAGDRLYAGIKDQRRILVFSFPGLAPLGEIPTRGLPRSLVLREGKILSVTATAPYSGLHLLETFTP